ncbi:MAG: DinB family protein [Gemmatimonadota bacterium]
MSDLDVALVKLGTASAELLVAADNCAASWTVPRALGKWSPAQVVEHVARSFDESVKVVAGEPSSFPVLPRLIRPIVRAIFFTKAIKRGVFPTGAKTNKPLDPEAGSATPSAARARLDAAVAGFAQACRAQVAAGHPVMSTVFGAVPVVDYVRFQELHVRHHTGQMPGPT